MDGTHQLFFGAGTYRDREHLQLGHFNSTRGGHVGCLALRAESCHLKGVQTQHLHWTAEHQ